MERSDNVKIIVGEVRSEPLNHNFSKLASEIGSVTGFITGDTILKYSNGNVVEVLEPHKKTEIEYTDGLVTKIIETKDNQILTTTFNYDENGVIQSINKEVQDI